MKPYYKQGGFFDRLERLSKIMDTALREFMFDFEDYGIFYFIPGFRKIATLRRNIADYDDDIRYIKGCQAREIDVYNREKYWWMRAK